MPDLSGYPHILQQIIAHSDGPEICAFLRLSSFMHALAIPILYPFPMVDSHYTPRFAPALPYLHMEGDYLAKRRRLPLSDVRRSKRINSFLSSPHVARAQTILLNHPQEWARDLMGLTDKPIPVCRSKDTVTIIRVEPMARTLPQEKPVKLTYYEKVLQAADGFDNWEGPPGKVYSYEGAVPVPEDDDHPQPQPYDVTTTRNIKIVSGAPDYCFQHIFDIAALIPSSRLVLYVPAASGINLYALISAAWNAFGFPHTSLRSLTIVAEAGNSFDKSIRIRSAVSSQQRDWLSGHFPWNNIELVLLPNPNGIFTFYPDRRSDVQAAKERASKLLLTYMMYLAEYTKKYSKTYTMVGVEGMEVAQGGLKAYKETVMRSCPKAVAEMEVKIVGFEEWKRVSGKSILASCALLERS